MVLNFVFLGMKNWIQLLSFGLLFSYNFTTAQNFYFGADLSYVNEMEDCGVVYKEDGQAKDPYQIFADHNCNLVRLRLWHTPAWHDNLNSGNRYSDFSDVKRSIQRAKSAGMQVLLDFHLSDNWADPGKQLVPAAWLPVVNNLPVLKDSLYNYISNTLLALDQEDLLPEMVQIGNETNKGILLSPEDNAADWTLDWNRNAQLFNRAIEAVRAVELGTGKTIEIALHLAAPDAVEWYVEQFANNGVSDFDIIGMSYYWAWHQPTSIAETKTVIETLRSDYPDKEVMIFETGYIWTTQSNDAANNIISTTHPDYTPPSPNAQKQWLVDLTEATMQGGGKAVIYWEPAWVSSSCWTQWGQGSHQEHATFFDFNSNLIEDGGISWMTHPYATSSTQPNIPSFNLWLSADQRDLYFELSQEYQNRKNLELRLFDVKGQLVLNQAIVVQDTIRVPLPNLTNGYYVASVFEQKQLLLSRDFTIQAK